MGETMSAARAIIGSATQILSVVNMAMAGASAVVIGNSVGDNQLDRAMREGIAYCVIAVVIGCIGSVMLMLVGDLYLSLYAVGEATLETARSLMLVVKILMPMQMLSYVTSKGILRGGGDTKFLLFGDIILLWTISIPLGALAAFIWNMYPFWVFMFIQAEYALKGLLCGGRFLSKKWIKVIASDKKA
jgi:Na+-driven multidrug efflux pump